MEYREGFYVYCLESERRDYIGAATDPHRRIRQHNALLCGGAKRNRCRVWNMKLLIGGFHTWKQALQFEWAFKYHSKNCRSIDTITSALETLMAKERWTSNSPLASEITLHVEHNLETKDLEHRVKGKVIKETSKNVESKPLRKWKRRMHGVT